MDRISGGKEKSLLGLGEALISAEKGELKTVIDAIEAQTDKSIEHLMTTLAIDDYYMDRVRDSVDRAAYRVVGGASVATDLDIRLEGNLVDQLATVRGADCVKVHISVFEVMQQVWARTEVPEGVSPQQLTWVWEIGRYVGRSLQRRADAHIAPLSIPTNHGMLNFYEKVAADLFGDGVEFSLPAQKELQLSVIEDYRLTGMPERLASAMGNVFTEYFLGATPELLEDFGAKLREKIVKPYNLAHDFGNDFRPDISYRELAATHPLSHEELSTYLEYISKPSDTIYLYD